MKDVGAFKKPVLVAIDWHDMFIMIIKSKS